ncbi:methyltransferase domain-containing protein [Streptomyces sp. NPDC001508]|uniref:SAM-dependent methyltransferase n=1 Tax=Streptomyces sp. NPDC001508 TaxID=3154656 RepID=UPI00331E3C9C
MTIASVAAYYDDVTDLISADLGGGLHFGYWEGLPEGSTMADASRHMTELMIDKLRARPGHRILDVGCGVGGPAVDLARNTGADVVGVNISERQLAAAERLAAESGLAERVHFQYGDAMALSFGPDSFDGAWLFEALFHMSDQEKVLQEIARVLRPGGRLAIANLVQRTALSDAQNTALAEYWKVGHVAALLPLDDYPALLSRCGLALEELTDISEHSTRQTFQAIRDTHAQRALVKAGPVGPAEVADRMDAGMNLFAETPEIGFAIVVAVKE